MQQARFVVSSIFKKAQMITTVLFFEPFIFVGMAFLSDSGSGNVVHQEILKIAFFAMASIALFLPPFIKEYMFKKSKEKSNDGLNEVLLKSEIVGSLLSDHAAILGFIYFVLTNSIETFYIFVIIGLVAKIIHFPRKSRWIHLLSHADEI